MRTKFPFTVFALFLLIPALTFAADDVKVSTIFDKKTLEVNDQLTLTIKIVGSRINIQRPRIPLNESFDSFYSGRASRFLFQNGQQESVTEFRYTLVPKRPGVFKVGPIEVQVNDETYRTEPVEIEVLGTPGMGAQTSQMGTFPGQAFSQSGPATGATVPQAQATVPQAQATVPQAQATRPASPYYGSSSYPGSSTTSYTARSTPYVQQTSVPPPVISPGESDVIFLRAWVDKTSVYPGEQILLTFSIYTRADTRYEGFEEEPQATGFWIEELPIGQNIDRSTVVVGGRKYIKADIRKMAIFATAPGDFTIQPGSVKASIEERPQQDGMFDDFFNDSFFGGGGLFARRVNKILAAAPITIEVKELPERGKPSEFSGTIGRFTFTSSIDKKEVKQNEPVTMTLKIEGEGNIETLQSPPVPEIENFKIYDGESSSQLFKRGNTIVGSKTFEIIFIPEKAGQYTLPSMLFNYFDPVVGAYKAERTPDYQIKVLPGEAPEELKKMPSRMADELKQDLTKETSDIYTIKTGFTLSGEIQKQKEIRNILAGTSSLLGLGFFVLFLARMRSRAYQRDMARYRKRQAAKLARRRHRRLSRNIAKSAGKSEREHYVEAAKILDQYFSDKFGLSPQGLTFSDIENRLMEFEIAETLLDEVRKFYETADLARFTGHRPAPEQFDEMVGMIERIINEIERKK